MFRLKISFIRSKLVFFVASLAVVVAITGFVNNSEEVVTPKLPVLVYPYANRDPLPDLSKVVDIPTKKNVFFTTLLPMVQAENSHVLILREQLNELFLMWQTGTPLSLAQENWVKQLSVIYRYKNCKSISAACFDALMERVDIIPPSLVLAQAANESAWGTSRFATRGNNLFGQWCFTKGCGLVPEYREGDADHEVKTFASPHHSVRSYMLNLNTHRSYRGLRAVRAELRENEQTISGVHLATGLSSYSQRGQEYVDEIVHMILYNKIDQYDS